MEDKFIRLGISVDADASDYAAEILENLQRRQFTLKDAGITSRVHNNWRSSGIVPDSEEDGKKFYFDFIQYLWLQIVKDLRTFGLPLETIAAVKDYLFEEDFKSEIQYSDQDINDIIKGLENKHNKKLTEEEFELMYEEVKISLKSRNTFMPYRLSLIVLGHLQYRTNTNIYIFLDGQVAVWNEVEQELDPASKPDLNEPHISIPLGYYFAAFLTDETKAEFLPKTLILSREESEVLRAMRNNEVKELTIKFSKKGNKRKADLITKVDKKLTDKQKREIARILGTSDYSTITMKTQNGTQLTFEEAQRTRL